MKQIVRTTHLSDTEYERFQENYLKATNEMQGDKSKNEKRIHPTQKPVNLYKWLLMNYAKQGDKILDTHVGSASSLIACYEMGFEFLGFEKDKHIFNLASNRLKEFMSQIRIYDFI